MGVISSWRKSLQYNQRFPGIVGHDFHDIAILICVPWYLAGWIEPHPLPSAKTVLEFETAVHILDGLAVGLHHDAVEFGFCPTVRPVVVILGIVLNVTVAINISAGRPASFVDGALRIAHALFVFRQVGRCRIPLIRFAGIAGDAWMPRPPFAAHVVDDADERKDADHAEDVQRSQRRLRRGRGCSVGVSGVGLGRCMTNLDD